METILSIQSKERGRFSMLHADFARLKGGKNVSDFRASKPNRGCAPDIISGKF